MSGALVGAGLAAMIGGSVLVAHEHDHGPAARPPGPGVSSSAASPSPELGTPATPKPAAPVPGEPVQVRIPALAVDAPVLPVHAPGRTLVPPSDPARLGWWADGAEPGSRHGAVLIAGHTVHNGPGALNQLGSLPAGSRVVVRTSNGKRLSYEARRVRTFTKGAIAAKAGRLFAQHGRARLVLVTCADWDGSRYLSNAVVVAVPV